MADTYDVVIIGSGPGGYVAAVRAGTLGLKTAIVEREKTGRLGGTCLLRGCIPTKALLWTAELYAHMQHAGDFGIDMKSAAINWPNAHKHKEKVVEKGVKGIDYLMKKRNVTVIKGHARLAGKGKVEVELNAGGKQVLDTKNVLLAMGSIVKALPNVPIDHKRILSSDSILELQEIPKSIIVLGAGAVGCEFASIFNHVGSETKLVEFLPRLLPIEDADVSKEIEKHFTRRKGPIEVFTGTKVEQVEPTSKGVKVKATRGTETVNLEAELLLSAVGRAPVTNDFGMQHTNIKLEKGGQIVVNAMMQTTEPNVYAIGDITPYPMLAHVASAQGIVAVEHIAGKNPPPINYDRVPNATYCYPEVASVGLTEAKAKERGYDVKVGQFPFSAVHKATISGEAIGFAKVVSEKKYDEVLGVHIVGPHATELLAEACVALKLETTTEELGRTIHAHPTLSEVLHEAAELTLGHSINI
jgi:dihydrolipoamide dehydrogenase